MKEASFPLRFRSGILMCYREVAEFVGLDPFRLLNAAKIDPRLLVDADAWLPAERVNSLLEESATLSRRDDFGVLLAECQAFSTLGPVALLLEHERTVKDIVDSATEFRPLISEAVTVRLEEEGDTAAILFDIHLHATSPQLTSNVVVFGCNVLVDALGGAWRPSLAHFRHSRPAHLQTYERALGCPIEFDSSYDGLSCERETVHVLSPSAEATLVTYARRLLHLSPEMSAAESLADHVRNAVYLNLRYGAPTLARVAANMGMSGRSLQRRLADEEHSFEEIVGGVRRGIVTQFLAHSRQSLAEIAHSAGFSSANTLARWFRREFGVSPSAWRNEQLQRSRRSPAALEAL